MQHVPNLSGVPQTLLWALYNRAAEARRPDSLLSDPNAIRIADAIAYDYERFFGKPRSGQVIRAILSDKVLREWIILHPQGQVVALGEGLETQFYRVDNGKIKWLAIDLPESIELRAQFIPDSNRHRNLACSALDYKWMNDVNSSHGIFITAIGLLKYFKPDEVRSLVTTIATRFPDAEMIFDVMPHLLVSMARSGWYRRTKHYTVPAMHWGLNRNELQTIKEWHPNISELTEIDFKGGRGVLFNYIWPLLKIIPLLGNHLFSLVHLRMKRSTPSQRV
jgi:O-methyltransferase involved in polyketide biosynthesis